jgi:phospholipase C
MGYFVREDIPFQYALADAFTIDAYHCSVLGPTGPTGPTGPNRNMWLAGTIDPDGEFGGPSLTKSAPTGIYSWKTYPERLVDAGVSWKVYHEPLRVVPTGNQTVPHQEKGNRPRNRLTRRAFLRSRNIWRPQTARCCAIGSERVLTKWIASGRQDQQARPRPGVTPPRESACGPSLPGDSRRGPGG